GQLDSTRSHVAVRNHTSAPVAGQVYSKYQCRRISRWSFRQRVWRPPHGAHRSTSMIAGIHGSGRCPPHRWRGVGVGTTFEAGVLLYRARDESASREEREAARSLAEFLTLARPAQLT